MKKKGIFLPQETNETCGISCMLMALTALGKIRKPKPAMGDEKSAEAVFYEMYGCKATKGTLGSAIAYALSCRRLDVELWHESSRLLKNRGGYYSSALHEEMLREHMAYIGRGGFRVCAGMPINADRMINALAQDRLLIVQCLIEGDADGMHDHVLHWILVFDYRDGEFLAYDPLYIPSSRKSPSYIRIARDTMQSLMKTPLGASAISVGEKASK
ncbi:MAG: hypothetical protein IKU34_11355 [Clostridia bacterium]|nr:hypothetical protein [Clostridia bacterium]